METVILLVFYIFSPADFFRRDIERQLRTLNNATEHQKQFLFVPHQIFFNATNVFLIVRDYESQKGRFNQTHKQNIRRMRSWHDKLTRLRMWNKLGIQYLKYSGLKPNWTVCCRNWS